MSEEKMQTSPFECPAWFDGKKINETVFCEEFLRDYPMVTVNDAFFTVNGRVHDENRLKKVIYDRIKYYVTSGVAKKVTNLLDVMRMECCTAKLSLYQDRIHVANGTYYLNGTFSPEKDFCRNRLPVAYNPAACDMAAFFIPTFRAGGHSDLAGVYGILLYPLHQGTEDAPADR